MPLRIGLLGLGKHGRRYAEHLAKGDIKGARLTAVWRRDRALGEADAKRLGGRFVADPEALIMDPEVDAVIAAVPAGLHADLAPRVAAAKKPLLLEKPLAIDLESGRAICAAFDEARVMLMVAQTLRFDPLVVALREQITKLGSLRGFGFEQRLEPRGLPWEDDPALAGSGVLFQTAVHTVDALRVITGGSLEVLAATAGQVHYRNLEDHVLLHLRAHGPGLEALGDVRVSKIGASRHHRFSLYADDGGLEADFIDRTLSVTRGRARTVETILEVPTVVRAAQAFVDAIATGGPSPISGRDALRTIAVLDAARTLQKSGGRSSGTPLTTS